jgi:uncharacterized membrane protein
MVLLDGMVLLNGMVFQRRNRMKSALMACGLILAAAPLLLAQTSPQFGTPEPASFVLLGTGVAGLGFAVWRRSRTKK